jgi:hypothetical protein
VAQGVGPEFKPQYRKKKKLKDCAWWPTSVIPELRRGKQKGFKFEPRLPT